MLPDSFPETPDSSTSLLCLILFTGQLLSRESNTNSRCLLQDQLCLQDQISSAFETFFVFALLPGRPALVRLDTTVMALNQLFIYGSTLLQTLGCTSLLHEVQWSALFLLPGSNFLEAASCFCPSVLSDFASRPFSFQTSFLQSHFPELHSERKRTTSKLFSILQIFVDVFSSVAANLYLQQG